MDDKYRVIVEFDTKNDAKDFRCYLLFNKEVVTKVQDNPIIRIPATLIDFYPVTSDGS